MTKELDPVNVAVDMLKKALPGFETRIFDRMNAIEIRGALPIYGQVSQESILMPVGGRSPWDNRNLDRTAIESLLFRDTIEPIIERVQQEAIKAVNLQPRIDRMVEAAIRQAKIDARREGVEEGIRQGRIQVLRELEEARQGLTEVLDNLRLPEDEL